MSSNAGGGGSSSSAQALQVTLAHLAGALTYTELSNVDTNRKLWNEYARNYAAAAPADGSSAATAPAASSGGGVGDSAAPWVIEMASHVSRGSTELECLGDEWSDKYALEQSLAHFLFPYLGRVDALTEAEWNESAEMERRIAAGEKIINHLPPTSLRKWATQSAGSAASTAVPSSLVVAELGVGGGRVATRVYSHVKQLHCLDIAEAMLQQAQQALIRKYALDQAATAAAAAGAASVAAASSTAAAADAAASTETAPAVSTNALTSTAQPANASAAPSAAGPPPHVSFTLLTSSPQLPPRLAGTCDFAYCFDVMPHVDLHTISGYFRSLRAVLRPSPSPEERAAGAYQPRLFLHTANLLAPLGWDRFSKQTKGTAGGFFFQSPDIIAHLARQHGYRLVQQSRWSEEVEPQAEGSGTAAVAAPRNLYYQRDLLFVLEPI